MISHKSPHHNRRTAAAILLTAALAALTAAGCRDEAADGGRTQAQPEAAPAALDCPVAIDTGAWDAFAALGDRITAREAVPRADLEALAELPAMQLWRAAMEPNSPPPLRIANWVEKAFQPELGSDGPQKRSNDRFALGRSYRYSYDHHREIDDLIAGYAAGGACSLLTDLHRWLDPDKVPTPLRLVFLPAKPELRVHDSSLLIDTGVLMAGGIKQTDRQLVSLLFRQLQGLPGPSPLDLEGDQAVAQAFRLLLNEGLSGWIERTPDTYFRRDHPDLAKVTMVPETFFNAAIRTLDLTSAALVQMFEDPAMMAARGREYPRMIVGGGNFKQIGYCMMAVIAGHFGEDRLREVRSSVPDFLAAYQAGALANPEPRPLPGAAGTPLYQTMPPLDAQVYDRLHSLLLREFPADS